MRVEVLRVQVLRVEVLRLALAAALLAGGAVALPTQALPPGPVTTPAPSATDDCVAPPQRPAPWVAQLTPPRDTAVTKTEHWLPRPDGTLLEVTVYRPQAFPGRRPTVLFATPYSSQITQAVGHEELDGTPAAGGPFGLTAAGGFVRCEVPFLLRRGYAFVVADLRGTGDSTGCYDLGGRREQEDGRAVVDWVASQGWSDGAVGMTGHSLEGLAQLATAVAAPRALRAVVPSSPSEPWGNSRSGGVLQEVSPLAGPHMAPPAVRAGRTCSPEHVEHEYAAHGWRDAYWQERTMARRADRIRAAVLMTVGNPIDGTYGFWDVWEALEAAGVPRKGLVGPWGHQYPTVDGWWHHQLRWYEHHLRGIDTGVMDEPPLTLLDDTGGVQQRSRLDEGPPPTGLALTAGRLVPRPVTGTASWTGRPGLPRPALEADPSGHLRYEGEPVARDQHLTGRARLELVATLDRDDADLLAVLYDVAPDGARRYVSRGMLDAQLRGGLDRPPVAVPVGVPQRYALDLFPRHHRLRAGHRLQLVLSSSEACYDCGHPGVQDYLPWAVTPDGPPARVTVSEGPGRSRLLLPLRPA